MKARILKRVGNLNGSSTVLCEVKDESCAQVIGISYVAGQRIPCGEEILKEAKRIFEGRELVAQLAGSLKAGAQ